jgi:hypothetical protein
MKSVMQTPLRASIRLCGIVFPMLIFLCAHQSASADCGSYVTVGGRPPMDHAVAAQDRLPDSPQPKTACNSPQCRQRPALPMSPEPSAKIRSMGDETIVPVLLNRQTDTFRTTAPESETALPQPLCESIFHPPR